VSTYTRFLDVEGIHERAQALADAFSQVGDRQVRNCGTVGGNIADANPASELPQC